MLAQSIVWRRVTLFSLLVAALAWPALYNGQPIFYNDTTVYIRAADAGVQAALHHRTQWSLFGADAIEKEDPGIVAAPTEQYSINSIKDKNVQTGRSPFYGALLYFGEITGGFWLSIALQALAVLVSLTLVLRVAHIPIWPQLFVIVAVITMTTSAPFFVSFMMPDVFAAVTILAASVLIFMPHRLNRIDYLVCFFLLCASLVFHDSFVLIVVALLASGIVANLVSRTWANWPGMTVIALALAMAGLAHTIFVVVAERVIGAAPVRPPFLMARVIEDGPGFRYLRATCPANGFKVCDFLERLPVSADEFLWARTGVFAAAPQETRRQISAEELRFVINVVAYEPWGQLAESLRNVGAQLTLLGLDEFEYTALEKAVFEAKVPHEHLQRIKQSAAYNGAMPVAVFSMLNAATFLIGSIFVVFALSHWKQRLGAHIAAFLMGIVAGVLSNAAICGILSVPSSRYSARVAWLMPFAALLIVFALSAHRRSQRLE